MAFSKNVWLGVTVTCQEDVDRIGPDFAGIDHPNKFVSYEPMMWKIRDWKPLGKFGWLYMGALTDGRGHILSTKEEGLACWVLRGEEYAREIGAKIWEKESLKHIAIADGARVFKETPWLKGKEA
jgi:protein gp37